MTTNSTAVQDQKILLALCHKKYADLVSQIAGVSVISTENKHVIGIINQEADIDDPLELLSSGHEKLIELAKHIEVLPVKVGTVISDSHISMDLEKAEILLKNYEGCVEAIIKGSYNEDQLMEEVLEVLPNDKNFTDEDKVVYGQKIAEVIQNKRNQDVKLITQTLDRSNAIDYDLRNVDGFKLCNISILMKREDMDKFEQIFRELVNQHLPIAKFEFIAPLPIYSFINN